MNEGDICVCSSSYGPGRRPGPESPAGTPHYYRFGVGEAVTLCGQDLGYHFDGTRREAMKLARDVGLAAYPCKPCSDALQSHDPSA